jgi:hypothetical protein
MTPSFPQSATIFSYPTLGNNNDRLTFLPASLRMSLVWLTATWLVD